MLLAGSGDVRHGGRVADFYRRYAPKLAPKVSSVLKAFEGRERELQEKLKQKYGAAPAFRKFTAPAKHVPTKPGSSRPSSARPVSAKPASPRPSSAWLSQKSFPRKKTFFFHVGVACLTQVRNATFCPGAKAVGVCGVGGNREVLQLLAEAETYRTCCG